MGKNLIDLEHKLNYYFNDKKLLKLSLIHRSFGNEHHKYKNLSNERLELLGDAILNLIVTEYLYKKHEDSSEGTLAKIKSMAVSEPVLSEISRKLDIGKFMFLSKGEEITGGRNRDSILGDVFEAILGAIYLDSSFYDAKKYTLFHLEKYIDDIENNEKILDFKSILQEYSQKHYKSIPCYTLIKEKGPDHKKVFEILVEVNGISELGIGSNKKMAEQLAARNLCKKLGVKNNETL